MAIYTLPKKFHSDFRLPNKKPINQVEIDWSNPLSRGLVFLQVYGSNGYEDLVSGQVMGTLGSAHKTVDRGMQGFKTESYAGTDAVELAVLNPIDWSGVTCISVFVKKTTGNFPALIMSGTVGVSTGNFLLTDEAAGIVWKSRKSETNVIISLPANILTTAIATSDSLTGDQVLYTMQGSSKAQASSNHGGSFQGVQAENFIGYMSRSGGRSHVEPIFFTCIYNRALEKAEVQELQKDLYQILKPKSPATYFVPSVTAITAALTGTGVPTQTEDDTVNGGKTIIITLTGDTFVTGTSSEDGIAGGSDSDKTGANKWDALIKTALDNTDVVLSVGDTVATITLPAFATYDTAETETITWTIPAASLTTSVSDITATPTHTVTAVSVGGRIMGSLAGFGGLAGHGGLAGPGGGSAG